MKNKKIYFSISNGDTTVISIIEEIIAMLKCEMEDTERSGDTDLYKWTIKAVKLTDKQYENLPEA